MGGQIMAVLILATIFAGIALIVAVSFWGVKLTRRFSGGGTPENRAEETRLIQEIYAGLNRMEERIEVLETILLERRPRDKNEREAQNA